LHHSNQREWNDCALFDLLIERFFRVSIICLLIGLKFALSTWDNQAGKFLKNKVKIKNLPCQIGIIKQASFKKTK
jgi:hypothetical protein